MNWQWHVCEVCAVLDGDDTLKPCTYCSFCDAWLCEHDLQDWLRRTKAAAIVQGQRFFA